MRVIICGGRDFVDLKYAYEKLDAVHKECPITEVIEGGARGADQLGFNWAIANSISVRTVRAEWKLHGRAAGIIRNTVMANMNPDEVLALPGGNGTANMISQAEKRGIKVRRL